MTRTLLAAALLFAPLAQAAVEHDQVVNQSEIPAVFEAAFVETRSISLSPETIEAIKLQVQDLIEKANIAGEYREDVLAQIVTIVEAANQGDIVTAWNAVQELREIAAQIKADWDAAETRGFFGLIGGAVDLIKGVQAGDNGAILKAVGKILWNLVF